MKFLSTEIGELREVIVLKSKIKAKTTLKFDNGPAGLEEAQEEAGKFMVENWPRVKREIIMAASYIVTIEISNA